MKKENGFSMAELLVGLGLLGVIAAVALPSYQHWMVAYRLNAAARILYTDMQLARMKAIAENCDYLLCFDTENDNYAIYKDASGDGLDESDECLKTVAIRQDYPGIGYGFVSETSPSGNPISSAVTFTGTPRRFAFKPTGLANKWGSVYFASVVEPYDEREELQRAITVILTGRTRLYRHTGTGWE